MLRNIPFAYVTLDCGFGLKFCIAGEYGKLIVGEKN